MDEKEFRPYIPAEKITSEFTVTSIIIGILLAIVFGAANAYLGLRVGMTVSASIPAAVISMGIIRVVMKKDSILESNMVQTIGSAGESLAAGAIFTLPALFLWANEGKTDMPGVGTITVIALAGGILGVLFMVPLRNALIVKEHGVLPYPEGTACAEVLLAGEREGSQAKTVFAGMGLSAGFKFIVDGIKIVPGVLQVPVQFMKTIFAVQVYPALLSVGYICGVKIASYMFAGGLIGWFVLIPSIAIFGGSTILYPGDVTISQMAAEGGASALWGSYIRYIGAGAVAAGGMVSLIKALPLIITTFRDALKGLKKDVAVDKTMRTQKELDVRFVLGGILLLILALWLLPPIPVSLVGAILIVVFGFFFATVSSRMVGLVGSSNNPVSGMAIATLLFSTLVLKLTGMTGIQGMVGAIAIGSVICIVAAMAGDTSQDLKTGYILGATPRKQQIGELIGVVVSAASIGAVLMLLNQAWGFGSEELAAPQATLMRMITEGVMGGNLPWGLIFIGIFIALAIEILGIPVLPVAIGLYLPLELSSSIMLGGLLRYFVEKWSSDQMERQAGGGILFCSGMIAGEGLVGILLALMAVAGWTGEMENMVSFDSGWAGSLIVLILMMGSILFFSLPLKRKEKNEK